MPEVERTPPNAWDDRPDDARDAEIAALEEALTLAAAAPGRRRLDRLEELLLVRAGQASRD
jgi:hypothetical protein